MFGIEVNFKDGSKEWIDPCDENPEKVGDLLFVRSIYERHRYSLQKIDTWVKYQLCSNCKHDLREYNQGIGTYGEPNAVCSNCDYINVLEEL